MAKGLDTWIESAGAVLEMAPVEDNAHLHAFEPAVTQRAQEIAATVDQIAWKGIMYPQDVAEFQSGQLCEAPHRYVEHAAMLRYLGQRGLIDEYWEQFRDGGDYGEGVTAFTNIALDQQVNWFFTVTDIDHPRKPVKYQFLSQVGDDGESWSYKMKVNVRAPLAVDFTKKSVRNRQRPRKRRS